MYVKVLIIRHINAISGVEFMATLRSGQWKAPFWGAEKSFITGQDMLGMQNTSIATYGVLVPGLTNLTRRIRYYGFYTWILEQYAKKVGMDSVSEFQKFVRRAELLLAYMMAHQFPDTKGVVGKQFAVSTLKDCLTEIDLAKGADREEGKITYWKYSSGAFGQYYQGALIALRLIAPIQSNQRIFAATPDLGRKLCACFENSISENKRDNYLSAVIRGKVTKKDLELIAEEFCLTNILMGSSEQLFYRMLIMESDFPGKVAGGVYRYFRKDTILLYLSYLQDESRFQAGDNFWNTFYTSAWKGHPLKASTSANGWLYYSLNENTHFCLETFLWHLLIRLEDGALYLQEALEILKDEVVSELQALLSLEDVGRKRFQELAVEVHATGYLPFEEISTILKEGRKHPGRAAAQALIGLARMYIHIEESINDLAEYSRLHRMDRDGDCLSFFVWVQKHQDLSSGEFLKKLLLHNIINRHLEVAMRKMRNRNENTLKFIFEDYQLKHVSTFPPVFTTPRIPSLHYFLEDIGFIKKDSRQLTPDGIIIIDGGINE